MGSVNISGVESDWMRCLSDYILEGEESVWHLWWSSHLAGSLQTQHQQVHHQTVVLYHKGGELQASDDTIRIGMIHILKTNRNKVSITKDIVISIIPQTLYVKIIVKATNYIKVVV